jgi:ferrochelatase
MKLPVHPAHTLTEQIGVLLVNSGTPDSTSTADVRRFLANLLGDPRVVELPRWLWLPILHGIILRTRPARSARKYRQIWTSRGSPLAVHSEDLRTAIENELSHHVVAPLVVETAMLYSNPSIETAIQRLQQHAARRILVVPMFAQYSGVSTGAVFDQVTKVLRRSRWLPELRFINEYHDDSAYIDALSASARNHFRTAGKPQHLLMSFHGIPERYFTLGDPYYCKCHKTARLVAEDLGLPEGAWSVSFQSRYGPGAWLKPYTSEVLKSMPTRGVTDVAVICPGFAADCLETLEEIAIEGREIFLKAGGNRFGYVPALNAELAHAKMFASLILRHLSGWTERLASNAAFERSAP